MIGPMRQLHSVTALCLLAAAARARVRQAPFHFTDAAALRAATPQHVAAPAAVCADQITKPHMIARAGRGKLYGAARSLTEFSEATHHWAEALRFAGLNVGRGEWNEGNGLWTLEYQSPDGRALRDFVADPRQFAPKDEAALLSSMGQASAALDAAGLNAISARLLSLDGLLPSYHLLYLTRPRDRAASESQLRILEGEDYDLGIVGSAVRMVSTPKPWLTVYIGPRLGRIGLAAATQAELDARVTERKVELGGQGKRVFAEKRLARAGPERPFGAHLYFFQ